jgi:hypothetical protein
MTNLSDLDLETALRNADAAGDKSAASLLAQEWAKRKSNPVNADVAASMRVPEPQGFMEDSGINAFGRSVRENIGGAAGSALGGAGGLKLGASIGTTLGPIGTAVGGGIGMLGGSLAGAMFGGEVQQAVAPTSEDTLRILESDAQKSPLMSAAGNMLPYVAQLKMSPRALGTAFTKITPQMTAAETSAIVGNRVGTAVGAGLGGISETVVPMISGQEVRPENVILGTLFGGLFNEPNRLGRAMGLPSTPTLQEVRAGQMAASVPTPSGADGVPEAAVNAETGMVPMSPYINVDAVIGPRAVGFPETGVAPVDDISMFFRPPVAIDTPTPLALPENASSGMPTPLALPESSPNGMQARLRREQAVEVQQQIERLRARRDDMVKRGVDKKAIKQIEAQLKAREKAMMGLEFDTTIIAEPPAPRAANIVERNAAATPPQSRQIAPEIVPEATAPIVRPQQPAAQSADVILGAQFADDAAAQSPSAALALRESLAAQSTREAPVDPRMAARASGEDVIGRGDRPAFIAADAIKKAQLADDAVVQSPTGAAALRDDLARREAASNERVEIIPEDYARAQQNAAKGGDDWARVQANTEPAAAFRKADGELKMYDGHHRLVAAQQEGKPTLPVKIDGEGIVDIPVSAFVETPPKTELTPAPVGAKGGDMETNINQDGVGSVYPTTHNGKPKWSVQTSEKRGFGDYLFDTEAEAIGAARIERMNFESRQKTLNEIELSSKREASEKVGRESGPRAFTADLGIRGVAAEKAVSTLTQPTSRRSQSAGKIYSGTRAEVVTQMIADGYVPKRDGKTFALNKGDGDSIFAVTKTEHDFAEWLRSNDVTDSKPPKSSLAQGVASDTPEITALRKQIEKLDEDIFNAKEDGDDYGAQGLEIARRRVQGKLSEALNPQTPQSIADKIRAKKVAPGSKGQMSLPILGLSDAQMRSAWNGALEVAAKAFEAGASLAKAAKDALAWVRQNFPGATIKDAEFTKAVEADITDGLPAARRAGDKEAAQTAAAEMDRNPDKFFTDADSTPVKTYMDDVDKTMRNVGRDVMGGRAAKSVWQHIKDFNRNYLRGNQAALDDLAKGGSGTGRASPALEKLNTEINGTRPGAQGKGERGIWDDTITRTRARTNELDEAFNGVRDTVDNLGSVEKEAFLSNLVRWMQDPSYATKLKNQPAVLKAVDTLRKVTRDLYTDLKANGIDVGDAGPNYFSRSLDADVVRRNYDEFVDKFTKFYDAQWKQNDPKYVSDLVKAREAAKAYADASILGHEGIALDGSDLNLGVQRSGDPNFFKARTFTGAVSDSIDREAAKFYRRNPFETLRHQINRVERRIGLARAFGKVVKENGKDVLDPTAKWREFTQAAVKEGNEKIIPEVLSRYQMMFGIGGKVDPSTQAFQQAVRNLGYYAYLPFSGINSMTEPTVLAMRLNKPMSGLFQAYGKSFRSIARQIKNMPLDYKEKAADALGLAENATMRAAMSIGKLDDQGLLTDKNLAKYFFLTGNSIVSNATSNAAVDIGMSALRMSLLDVKHGREATSARMWLEELGIKRADFERVSGWLEGHATDEARFTKLFDKTPEAGIVRDAIRKFAREARSLPDAGTKNQHSAGTFGSMLLSLQSYLYDFTDKVLGRNARQFMTGARGKATLDGELNPTDLTPQERVRLMAPMMLGMPSLIAANYGIALVRETLYPDPEKIRRDRERTAGEIDWNRFQRALTRSNMMGPYDMLYNMFTQARYERDVAASALGPYMGGVLELAKSAIALGAERNSDNTNTAERKAARNFWNVGPKPLINMALSSLPGGKLAPVASAGIQLGSQRSVAEGFVDTVAGKPTAETKKKPKAMP